MKPLVCPDGLLVLLLGFWGLAVVGAAPILAATPLTPIVITNQPMGSHMKPWTFAILLAGASRRRPASALTVF